MNELLLGASQVALAGLWQGLLVAAAVAVCLRLVPRVSAAQRFAVWVAAFVVAAGLPFVSAAHRGGGSAPGLRVGEGWGAALALVWIALVAVRALRLLLQALRVRKIWLAARPVPVSAEVAALLAACPRRAEVCASDEVDAPSVIGFWSPRLLVPAGLLAEIADAELQQIAMHECEHLRRGDDWVNLAQKLALTLFPLNVGLLLVDRRLGLERELACDAGVVAATGAPLEYASCLARLAERRLGGGRLVLALSAWARRSELARRVYTLLEPMRLGSRAGGRAALAAVACVLLATADGIAHAPRMVSFAAAVEPVASVPVSEPNVVPVVYHADPPLRVLPPVRHITRVRAVQHRARPAARPGFYVVSAPQQRAQGSLVPVKFTYSYAAVPFGDGWLIVQL